MQRKFGKLFIATLTIGVLLVGVTGLALASNNFFFVGSTNTVTQVNYPTATSTSFVTTTGTVTVTGTPYETLTTVTTAGTQTYTTIITQTTGATATATATASEDFYIPFAMYYTATTNNPFYEQLSPIVTTATDGTAFTESGGSMSITTSTSTPPYYDLGFYYVFQNLDGGTLNAFNTYSITATGTAAGAPASVGGFATNLWINTQAWTWAPEGVGQDTFVNLGATGAYGLGQGALTIGGDTGTETVSSSSSFYITAAGASSCLHSDVGTTMTVAAIITACGSSTPFALWYGIVGPTTASTTASATINSIHSSPYP